MKSTVIIILIVGVMAAFSFSIMFFPINHSPTESEGITPLPGGGGELTIISPPKHDFPSVGDTVIVSVIGHGGQVGVVRAFYESKAFIYVDFVTKCCNGWYDPTFNKILPYKAEWTHATKQAEANGN